jgi:hypothetical protein
MNLSGLGPAVSAKMKLTFINPPKNAAMPVKRPSMRASPTAIVAG